MMREEAYCPSNSNGFFPYSENMKIEIAFVGCRHLQGVENSKTIEIEPSTNVTDLPDRFYIRKEHQWYIVPNINVRKQIPNYVLTPGDSAFLHLPIYGG
jgi:hypothetical protein